ncbi:MAG TPA: acyl-CoA dehydrogenase [Cyclobacteriaceae bacterium]|nr:acyl-CoA dehydrogenase [Cyclobacteriaceae bacterium]
MITISHPSKWIDDKITSVLREQSHEAERSGRLTQEQLRIIYANKWFKMFVPGDAGGLGLTLPQVLRVEEGLAWTDGSTAWVVTLCSGAGWFVGFIDRNIVRSIVHDSHFCIAGSGAVTGIAEANKDGYVVNGSWKYASGSLHATAFTANCKVDNDVKAFIFFPDEVVVKKTWNSMGMVATGSHSFEIKDLQVPKERAFVIEPAHAILPDAIYRYPFLQLAETTLAVNLSGLTSRFIDLCDFDATNSRNKLDDARQEFFESIDRPRFLEVSRASHNLVRVCREVINYLYPLCGLKAADKDLEINRVWRNFHTAAQHSIFNRR